MRVSLAVLLTLFVCFSATATSVQMPPEVEPALRDMNNGQLLEANRALTAYKLAHPNDPLADLLLALSKWKIMWISRYTPQERQELLDILDETETLCESAGESGTDCLFYTSATSAIRAQVYATENQWWRTAQESKKMKARAARVLVLDPEYYEANYVLGSFNYFADVLPSYVKFLRTLMFLPGGDRANGMKELVVAYQKGHLSSAEAGRTLALIYTYYERRFDYGERMCETLLAAYPDNYEIGLYKGVNLYFESRFDVAEGWFRHVRQQILAYSEKQAHPEGNHNGSGRHGAGSGRRNEDHDAEANGNEAVPVVPVYQPMEREVRYWIARCLIQQGKDDEAKEMLLALAVPELHQPYWLQRGVQLSLAQLAYRHGSTGNAELRIEKVLRWPDTKESYNKARNLRKKRGKTSPFEIDFL